jgi:hypothetical protein
MADSNAADPLSETLIDLVWGDPDFRTHLLSDPEQVISREAEILFENQPNDFLIFWEKLFG